LLASSSCGDGVDNDVGSCGDLGSSSGDVGIIGSSLSVVRDSFGDRGNSCGDVVCLGDLDKSSSGVIGKENSANCIQSAQWKEA
jgi:hypothetical protein